MRIALTILICILLSGCSLFKRVDKRFDKSEQFEKNKQLTKNDKSSAVKSSEQSSVKESEQTAERDTRDLNNNTSIEADEILIDSKGNISAKGNAKVNSKTKDNGVNEKASNKEVIGDSSKQSAVDNKEQNEDRSSKENKQKNVVKDIVSEPSGKGLILGAVAVLIIVLGLLWYFGVKRKKS